MHILLSIIALLIVLGVLVFVHEFGHFMAARWAKVRVDTFSIGFGPAIIKWHDKHNTVWKIACIPLGGYVSIYGQEDMFNRKKYAELPEEKKHGHYLSAPAWKQFIIIGAGVFMNFMLAWVIYSADFMINPKKVQLPVIGQVLQGTVAHKANIKPGDIVEEIDGRKINNWGELIIAKELASQHNADVLIKRNDDFIHISLEPAEKWGMVADGSKSTIKRQNFFNSIYSGLRQTYYKSRMILTAMKQIITGERSSKELGSLISIAQVSGNALSHGMFALLSLIALLSLNLAIFNLLPLPVLDGGYLFILIIEAIIRRKLTGKAMEIAILCGWILIALLFAFTMWNDIARLLGLN